MWFYGFITIVAGIGFVATIMETLERIIIHKTSSKLSQVVRAVCFFIAFMMSFFASIHEIIIMALPILEIRNAL